MLHAGDLRSQRRFVESDEILRGLKQSEPSLYTMGLPAQILTGRSRNAPTPTQGGQAMEKLSGRISSEEAIGNSGDLATSGQPNPESRIPATLGRRGLLRAGLTSSLSLLTGLAIGGRNVRRISKRSGK